MATPFGYKPRISQRFIGDSSNHRVDVSCPSYWLQGSIHRAAGHTTIQHNHLPSFPRRRESTGWMCSARHTGFKAVSTGRQGATGEQSNTTIHPSPLTAEDQSLSQCLTREQRVSKTKQHPPVRHCGLDPQSRGAGCDMGQQQVQNNRQNPLSLDGRGLR